MKAPKITETDECHAVAEFFTYGLGGHAIGFHIPNERKGAWARIRATTAGALWGMTDDIVLYNGRAFCIEMKPRGWRKAKLVQRTAKLDRHELRQLAVHKRLRLAGCQVEICETLDEVIAFLDRNGVPIKARLAA